ncbi:MAG TPA: hypothetical protein VFB33_12065 [Candidatus Binataceae bacterium]|nr:hypothetical protein [Candidatus Binataceae bacterium]
MRTLPTRIAALAAYTALAACVALLQGCAANAPQYAEEPPSSAPVSTGQAVPQSAATGGDQGGALHPVEATSPGVPREDAGVTGVWQGQLWANCNVIMMMDETRCGAVNAITLTLFQKDTEVSGFYKCAFGNMNCLNMNETGKIARGSVNAKMLSIRVMMPDGSDCMYSGRPVGDAMQGSYTCMQGGGLIEQGLWKARRSY